MPARARTRVARGVWRRTYLALRVLCTGKRPLRRGSISDSTSSPIHSVLAWLEGATAPARVPYRTSPSSPDALDPQVSYLIALGGIEMASGR